MTGWKWQKFSTIHQDYPINEEDKKIPFQIKYEPYMTSLAVKFTIKNNSIYFKNCN
jgi:hypothetical protein